ncbi:hypothetical protein ACOMHN_035773 [Nucella lapillus]
MASFGLRCGISAVKLMLMVTTVVTASEDSDVDDDHGFSLMFQSNREELHDVPVHFDHPLPAWLSGTLIRNGLGLFENGDRSFLHTFDGFAKLSSWRFPGNGSAFFSTRFLATNFYNESITTNTIAPYLTLEGLQPAFSFMDQCLALLRGLDNMNVNVYRFSSPGGGHDYVALSDYWKGYTFSPHNLTTFSPVVGTLYHSFAESLGIVGTLYHSFAESLGIVGTLYHSFAESLGIVGTLYHSFVESLGISSFLNLLSSAHPLPEPGTDHHLTFLSSMSLTGHRMQLVRVRSSQERQVIASWTVARIVYMHSFSVTETHALILAHPFYVNVLCMLRKATPFRCLDWKEEEAATLYVVELKTGEVTELTMQNVFTMHHVNAYNLDHHRLIMDLSTYPDPSFVGSLQLPILRDPVARNGFPAQARLQRFEVNLLKRTVTRVEMSVPQPAFINSLDMPTLNERYRSRHYCYVYGLVVKTDNLSLSKVAVVKRDVCGNGGDRSWTVPHHYPVEPVFIPHPQGVAEDEGVVLVPMIDGPSQRSYLAVLDARNLTLLTSASLPTVVSYSLHGRFFPEVL